MLSMTQCYNEKTTTSLCSVIQKKRLIKYFFCNIFFNSFLDYCKFSLFKIDAGVIEPSTSIPAVPPSGTRSEIFKRNKGEVGTIKP